MNTSKYYSLHLSFEMICKINLTDEILLLTADLLNMTTLHTYCSIPAPSLSGQEREG